jgi:hypothetical protein
VLYWSQLFASEVVVIEARADVVATVFVIYIADVVVGWLVLESLAHSAHLFYRYMGRGNVQKKMKTRRKDENPQGFHLFLGVASTLRIL